MTRTIKRSTQFKRDYKRERKSHGIDLDNVFKEVVSMLVEDTPLPPKYRDHTLTGGMSSYRECHLKPDLLLVYDRPDDESLHLARLGSHAELFG